MYTPTPPITIEEIEHRDAIYAQWVAAGRKCECGTPIEFEDAYQHGQCLACLQREEQEGWL